MRILYIDIDSLRPDHLGCYGYHRNTSPNIDKIAAEGLVCEQVYTPDAPCLPSRTAFYSGRFGIQTGVVGHGKTAATPKVQGPSRGFSDHFGQDGLATQLQYLGFHTAMISPFGQRHAAWQFYAGFNEMHNTGKGGMESAEEVDPVVEKWFGDNAAKDNWYLHLNFWDPHTPYRAPEAYGDPFADQPLPKWLDDDEVIARHVAATGPHTPQDFNMYNGDEDPKYPRQPGQVTDKNGIRKIIDGYDTGVRYVDDRIGQIVAKLKEENVYDDTMIIISADHGENLGELAIYGEHGTADEITCHIPMIIKYPGGVKGKRNSKFHYNLDFAPTLMDLLGREKPEIWDGESYSSAITKGADIGRDEVIISQCCHVCQRSVRWGKWIYMRTYHDGFHLFPQEMLYDLESDPHEQNDIAEQFPEICQEGSWRLSRWHDAQMQKMSQYANDVVDPLWTVIREGGPFHANLSDSGQPTFEGFKKYLKRLQETGRGDGAEALREKYARFL